jgi:SAM-dependent methyltransferase
VTSRDDSGTWHHGLIARYWAEFNEPEPAELAWYRAAIERFGQAALDLACGTGRLLLPLVAAGLDARSRQIRHMFVLREIRRHDGHLRRALRA